MSVKDSALPAAAALDGSEIFGVVQAGASVKATAAAVASLAPPVAIQVAVSDETTALTTGTAKITFRLPYAFILTGVRSSLTTSSSSGLPTVDIKKGGTSVLGTKLSIDAAEKTSVTAATPATITTTAMTDDAEMTIDITVAGTGATGLKVTLLGTMH